MQHKLRAWLKGHRRLTSENFAHTARPEGANFLGKAFGSHERCSDFSHIQRVFPCTRPGEEARQVLELNHVRRRPALGDAEDDYRPGRKSIEVLDAGAWNARVDAIAEHIQKPSLLRV